MGASMKIEMTQDGTKLAVALEGRLDTRTAPELDEAMKGALEGITELTFDLENLEYISSAGLRVLLTIQKTMDEQGTMVVKNASEDVMEVFEVTGFAEILTLE